MKLGELLALARELKGWSTRELEKRSGVDHAVPAHYETGFIKDPSFRKVCKLATALGISLERLSKTKDTPNDK